MDDECSSRQTLRYCLHQRVKALLSSRGKKVRRERGEFVVDNLPAIFSPIKSRNPRFPAIKTLYYTENGLEKLTQAVGAIPVGIESFLVASEVLSQMADVESSQGVLAIAAQSKFDLAEILKSSKKNLQSDKLCPLLGAF